MRVQGRKMNKWFYLITLPSAFLFRRLKGSQPALLWLTIMVLFVEQSVSYSVEMSLYGAPFTHWFDYVFTATAAGYYVLTAWLFYDLKQSKGNSDAP